MCLGICLLYYDVKYILNSEMHWQSWYSNLFTVDQASFSVCWLTPLALHPSPLRTASVTPLDSGLHWVQLTGSPARHEGKIDWSSQPSFPQLAFHGVSMRKDTLPTLPYPQLILIWVCLLSLLELGKIQWSSFKLLLCIGFIQNSFIYKLKFIRRR